MPSIKGTILESYLDKLSRIELDQLNERNQIENSIERQYKLKTFFVQAEIFYLSLSHQQHLSLCQMHEIASTEVFKSLVNFFRQAHATQLVFSRIPHFQAFCEKTAKKKNR